MAQVSTLPQRNESDIGHDLPVEITTSDFQMAVFTSLASVVMIGTMGNVLSLSVILFYRRLRLRPFNIITMFLIVVDLMSCSIVTPLALTFVFIYLRDNTVNKTICLITLFLNNIGKLGSLMTMSEIAILRVINLSNNVYAKKFVSKTSMAIIMIFNTTVVPVWAAWKSFFKLDYCDAIQSRSLEPQFGPAVEWCSFIAIIASTYILIACYTKRRAGQLAAQRDGRGDRYDIATIRTCIVIIAAFVLCHLPFLVYAALINEHVLRVDLVEIAFYFHFHLFSQAGNPIIMFCTCREFRKHVLMFVRFLFRRLCQRNVVRVPTPVAFVDVAGANQRR